MTRARKAALGTALALAIGVPAAHHAGLWRDAPTPAATAPRAPDPFMSIFTPSIDEPYTFQRRRICIPPRASILCQRERCVLPSDAPWLPPLKDSQMVPALAGEGAPAAPAVSAHRPGGGFIHAGMLHLGPTFIGGGGGYGGGGGLSPPVPLEPPGVPSAVPAPAIWAMMLTGLLLISCALRRRDKAGAVDPECADLDSEAGFHDTHPGHVEVFWEDGLEMARGWYWVPRWPGMTPEDDPVGPFISSAEARNDADPNYAKAGGRDGFS